MKQPMYLRWLFKVDLEDVELGSWEERRLVRGLGLTAFLVDWELESVSLPIVRTVVATLEIETFNRR